MDDIIDFHISVRPVKVGSLPRNNDIAFALEMPVPTSANAIVVPIMKAMVLSLGPSTETSLVARQ